MKGSHSAVNDVDLISAYAVTTKVCIHKLLEYNAYLGVSISLTCSFSTLVAAAMW